ncbi:hypothetical protein PMAYCL1PPCAC_06630 [Pristionchus mayeri]|uniref:Uncharacterized protein n=1 Tax=Pristionchus mayeri TaxID=1317129 RepID=A0AAN4ZG85_9BILA|nr:hypothetical protein PMAYCL1PPCAC_06630 [Pristionchus mayeri]
MGKRVCRRMLDRRGRGTVEDRSHVQEGMQRTLHQWIIQGIRTHVEAMWKRLGGSTSHHTRHLIDYSPEGPSFHFNRSLRRERKRDHRWEFDLSLSDQENYDDIRRKDAENYVERKMKLYKKRASEWKEENGRLREENDRLKKEREIMEEQFKRMKKELDGFRVMCAAPDYSSMMRQQYPMGSFTLPSDGRPSHSFYGHSMDSPRVDSAISSLPPNGAGESLSSPFFPSSASGHSHHHPLFYHPP